MLTVHLAGNMWPPTYIILGFLFLFIYLFIKSVNDVTVGRTRHGSDYRVRSSMNKIIFLLMSWMSVLILNC